ncbi:MAG: ATP-binding protein [Nitrospirae bacterium]|nr:ATP-binding protein [Nitrospirota bacterium]
MVSRQFWIDLIEKAWSRRSVIWLSGVRRAGKTYLCRSLHGIEYFDCELPRIRRMMEDPQAFLEGLRGKRIILDEVHRLGNPSEILKIAADHFPDILIVATGSSTLGASAKFRDTLSGRKAELWLTPMISADLKDFDKTDLKHRFIRGGLPPFFMADETPERDFQEWMDAYWAKDIQELFRLERRYSFQKFAELLIMQSGGIFEATRFADPCEVSRTTINNYLSVLESTYSVHVIRPFSSRRSSEIISAPKVYAFDTGFVCYYRGWHELRQDDMGLLWEHFVLNEIQARLQTRRISYWRDKRGHEIDFVLTGYKKPEQPLAIECKWSSSGFDAGNIKIFRKQYPVGCNYVVSADTDRSYTSVYDNISVNFVSLSGLIQKIGQ